MVMTWEQKIEKAKEGAVKKAEKDNLDEAAAQALIDEAVAKVMKAKEAAEAKNAAPKRYLVQVEGNPGFCGIGAGGIQFANGQAVVESERMARWFMEHDGYTVTEQ